MNTSLIDAVPSLLNALGGMGECCRGLGYTNRFYHSTVPDDAESLETHTDRCSSECLVIAMPSLTRSSLVGSSADDLRIPSWGDRI